MADVLIGTGTVTATGVVGSAASVASFSDDWTLEVVVTGMTTGYARVAVEDSTDSGSTWTCLTTFCLSGADATSDRTLKLRSYSLPSAQVGVANSMLRVNVTKLTASTITVNGTLKDV